MFPHEPYRRCFEKALERLSKCQACRLAVAFMALAHEENCEAELAHAIDKALNAGYGGLLGAGGGGMTDNQDKIATDPNKVDATMLSLMLTPRIRDALYAEPGYAEPGRLRTAERLVRLIAVF